MTDFVITWYDIVTIAGQRWKLFFKKLHVEKKIEAMI